jgi:hypothetical protein
MNTYFTHVSLIWSTGTSYDLKLDFKISKSNIIIRISLELKCSNGHNFGPSITHEV